jgi:bifunctional non-homologous end joining protein LigD
LDKISQSRHIRGVTVPRVQPIIPARRKEPFDDPEWLFEFKYDGFRGLCYLEQRCWRFVSRNGNILSCFEALGEQVAAVLDVDETIIDGEVIAVDETGRPQFYDLVRRTRSPAYVAFDILWLDGADLRSLPLSERRRRLQGILPKGSPIVSEALSVTGRGRELFELMCTNDLEGIVAKRLADPYETRVRWLKIKNPDYSQKEGREICSMGRGNGRHIRQAGGDTVLHGCADDARQHHKGRRAPDCPCQIREGSRRWRTNRLVAHSSSLLSLLERWAGIIFLIN